MWPWIAGAFGASAAWWNAQRMKRSVREVPWAKTAYKVLYEKDAEGFDAYEPRLEWPHMSVADVSLGYVYPRWNYKNAESADTDAQCSKCEEILDNDNIDEMWIITNLDGSNYILCDSCVDNAPGFYTSCKICGDIFEERDFTTSRGSLNRSRRDPPFDISDIDETVCLNCAKERPFESPQDAYIYAYNKGHIDARDRGTNYNPLEYNNKDFNKIIRHAEDEVVSRGKKGKVITLTGSDPRLRTIKEDKDITPEEAMQRTEISAEEENTTVVSPHQLGQSIDWQPFDESYFPTKKRAESFGVDPYEIERWACSWCGDEHSKHGEADMCCEGDIECDICKKDFDDMSDIHECRFCGQGQSVRISPWNEEHGAMRFPTRVCGDCCMDYPYLEHTYKICNLCVTELADSSFHPNYPRRREGTSLKQRAKKALQEGGRMGSSYPVKMDAESSETEYERCFRRLEIAERVLMQEDSMYEEYHDEITQEAESFGATDYQAEDNFESAIVFDKPKGPVEKALQYQMGIHDLAIQEALLSLDSDVRFGLISEKDAFQRFLQIVG